MIKKILLFSICILFTFTIGCGVKSKSVQEEKKEIKEHVDSTGTKLDVLIKVKDTLKQDECFENTGEADIIIERPDGSKIRVPKKGAYKQSKSQTHSNTFEKKESSAAVKKTTTTKTNGYKKEKDVTRKPFNIAWWLIIVIIVLIYVQWRLDNK